MRRRRAFSYRARGPAPVKWSLLRSLGSTAIPRRKTSPTAKRISRMPEFPMPVKGLYPRYSGRAGRAQDWPQFSKGMHPRKRKAVRRFKRCKCPSLTRFQKRPIHNVRWPIAAVGQVALARFGRLTLTIIPNHLTSQWD